jgi:hypothetical protein
MLTLPLFVICLHLFGEFVFNIEYMRQSKLRDWQPRIFHTLTYTICFWPLFAFCAWPGWFIPLLFCTHFLIDTVMWLVPNRPSTELRVLIGVQAAQIFCLASLISLADSWPWHWLH